MTKKEFFNSINDIISDKVYLTETLDELNKEIENNHWSIGIEAETSREIDSADLKEFLKKVIFNRIDQLEKSNKNLDLLFYLWFDEQAGNLNFSLINSNHNKVPFSATIEYVTEIDLILKDFLSSRYLDEIPFDELSDEETEEKSKDYVLKLYQTKLTKNTKAQ
jgi:hypothetical protein